MNTTEKPLDYQGLDESKLKNCYAVFGMYRGLYPQFNCIDNIEHRKFGRWILNDNTFDMKNKAAWLPLNYVDALLTKQNFTINLVIRGKGASIAGIAREQVVYFSGTSIGLVVFKRNLTDNVEIFLFGIEYLTNININTRSQTIITIAVRNDKLVIRVNEHTETHTISTTRPQAGSIANCIIGSGSASSSWNGYVDLMTLWTGDIDAQALHNAPYSVFK